MEPLQIDDSRLPIEKVDLSDYVCPENRNVCYLLRNVFTISECEDIVERMESKGFNDMGNIHMNRVIVDDKITMDRLFERIKDYIPEIVAIESPITRGSTVKLVGLNERIRCGRYRKGQYFYIHSDSQFMRQYNSRHRLTKENFECSALTVMIYLNSPQSPERSSLPSFSGGKTAFLRTDGSVKHSVTPEAGTAIIFTQAVPELTHEGGTVTNGTKYIYRTDVMYEFAYESYCGPKK
jgi:hypothetical protein